MKISHEELRPLLINQLNNNIEIKFYYTPEYSGGLNGKGFVFNNPNAQRTCGCGESFLL